MVEGVFHHSARDSMSVWSAIKSRTGIFAALRYRNYRLFWFGQLVSVVGFQMLIVAQGWLVYSLTGSKLQLGLVGLSSAAPSIILNLFGGVVADKVNPRRLIMATQSVSCLVLLVLATLTATHLVQPWHVMVTAFLMGGLGAFDGPSRQAMFPHLIDRSALMNAVALNSTVWQSTRVVGPALAGVLIAWVGPAPVFYMTASGFGIFVLFLARIRMPDIRRAASASFKRDMADGLRFIWSNHIFTFILGMTFFNSFFGMSYIFLMPVFQRDVLHVGPAGLGLLLSMGGVGALSGTAIVAALGNFRAKGLLMILGAVAFGVLLLLFAYSRWFPVSLVLVALAGAASSIYMVSAQSTLQMLVPDQFRGRVMGFWGITYNLMPLGGFQGGVIASMFSAPVAVAVGGTAVIVFALLGAARNVQIRHLGMQTAGAPASDAKNSTPLGGTGGRPR
ncbi:MAG: MFS transporter [Dehalococcoidia bacterium]|nr:MFS transporter [Dehalococcoidia bacterium]